jgi:death-on-curing family protein
MMQRLTVAEVERIAFRLAQEIMSFNEPIPDFGTRYPNVLESCLAAPFQSFGKKDLYPGFVEKAGLIFYLMIKNHPFQNGNKRVAMVALLCILHKNKKWLKVDTQALYNFAMWVASSPGNAKEEVVHYIQKFIRKYLVELD